MRRILIGWALISLLGGAPVLAGWNKGVAALKAANFLKAIQEFEEVVEQSPAAYQGYYMLGRAQRGLGRKADALASFETAYRLHSEDLGLRMILGRTYCEMRRFGEAVVVLEGVDDSKLNDQQRQVLHAALAKARSRLQDDKGAMKSLEVLLKMRPQDADLRYQYGSLALAQGQVDKAVAALAEAYRLAPEDHEKGRKYVRALTRQGMELEDSAAKRRAYGKAADVAIAIVAVAPTYDHRLLQLTAELGAGRFQDAVETGESIVADKGGQWLPHFYLGRAYNACERYDEAIAPLETANARATSKDRKKVLKALAYAHEKLADYLQSWEYYKGAGDTESAARVRSNYDTQIYNEKVERDNATIEKLWEIRAELEDLEQGGG